MPRFSDIFTYDQFEQLDTNRTCFKNCHLLKRVGTHDSHAKFDLIIFDLQGMFLFFEIDVKKFGPFPLTTV